MNLARDVKGRKTDCCNYISNKRKTGENVGPLLNGTWKLVKNDILNVLFISAFTRKICLQESQAPETIGKVWSK